MNKYEVGIHFKSNTSKKVKEQIEFDINCLSISFVKKDIVNKDLLIMKICTNKEIEIAKMLKEAKQIRYYYMELIKD